MAFISRACRLLFLIVYIVSFTDGLVIEPAFNDELNQFVAKTMKCQHIPGLTLSIVKGDETWSRGYGIKDLAGERKVDNSTLFGIGSVSKSFTMVLVGILLKEKSMTWTTKVSDILGPEYEFIDEIRTKETTVRDLLSHRTGLARLDIGLLAGYKEDQISRKTFSKKLKHLPEAFPFRDRFLYNNHLYTLLGHIAEVLGNDSWENLLKSRVFDPLGMTSTRLMLEPEDVLQSDNALPLIYKDGVFKNGTSKLYHLFPTEPAGAILSNGEDMAKYMRFNLNNGKTDSGVQLIDEKMFPQAFITTTPTSDQSFLNGAFLTEPDFPVSDTPMGYGYAWFTSSYRGNERIWHSGGLLSYITYLWLYPELKIGIFASANGPGYGSFAGNAEKSILYYVSDYLLNKSAWINETTTCEFPTFWRDIPTNSTPGEVAVDLPSPSEYVGSYGTFYLPAIEVTVNPDDDKSLRFQMNRCGGLLHSTPDKDRFLMEVTSPYELMMVFIDKNNATSFVNATFQRSGNTVNAIEFQYEVKVLYEKGLDVTNTSDIVPTTSTATPIFGESHFRLISFCLINLLMW
ncbi:hypothetical protein ACF0H5_011321 [Mactra antiquata]